MLAEVRTAYLKMLTITCLAISCLLTYAGKMY